MLCFLESIGTISSNEFKDQANKIKKNKKKYLASVRIQNKLEIKSIVIRGGTDGVNLKNMILTGTDLDNWHEEMV